jgi:rhamnosyltransferase subunit B
VAAADLRFCARNWVWSGEANPLFDAKHSPYLVLALFSRVLGVEQKDWPAHTLITGFCFYDSDAGNAALPAHLEKFLAGGAGAGGVYAGVGGGAGGGAVLRVLGEGGDQAGVRAVLLIGSDPRNRPRQALPETICVAEYAPYSALFSRAAMVVHQGGVGTTAQCLRAGKPMLIMPYSHDQPDNGRRMRRLKVARVIQRGTTRRCGWRGS